jgi:hypothetical protein
MLKSKQHEYDRFLGVAEEAAEYKVGSKAMRVSIDIPSFKRESTAAIGRNPLTEIYKNLISEGDGFTPPDIFVQLTFTDVNFWNVFKSKDNIEVIRVLNLDKSRYERTILEVRVKGIENPMVLKCIETRLKEIVSGNVQTITQQEIMAFDRLPQNLKNHFVRKYAHGRLWFTNVSYEVILMEKLSAVTLRGALTGVSIDFKNNTADPVPKQFVWLANAFGLLHRLHVAGWSHGDSHADNIIWPIGSNDLKFIDPERMLDMNELDNGSPKHDNETKAIRKLGDIYQLLFVNDLAIFGLNPRPTSYDLRVDLLHSRFKEIKAALASVGIESSFSLDDTIPYHYGFRGAGINKIEDVKLFLRNFDREQYKKFSSADFHVKLDEFTLKLSDPVYLQKVFIFTIMELNKSVQNAPIDESDFSFPISLKTQTQPRVPLPVQPDVAGNNIPGKGKVHLPNVIDVSGQAMPVQNGFIPLSFQGRFIQISQKGVVNALYYSVDAAGNITLSANPEHPEIITIRSLVQMLSNNVPVYDINGEMLYFFINLRDKTIEVYRKSVVKDPPYWKYIFYSSESLLIQGRMPDSGSA